MSDINEKSGFAFTFQPVTKLFEEQVRLHPEKCAVASGKESFTYAELNERANKIAHSLIGKGAGREIIVGVTRMTESSLSLRMQECRCSSQQR